MRQKLEEVERSKIHEISQQTLFDEIGKEALDYLKNVRKFSDDVIKKFQLGYMPTTLNHEFAGRIIIPILDQYGDLVALSSRDWRKDAKSPFWHESYTKSMYVYGLHLAKDSILKNKKAVIVEGEFDVIQSHQHGFTFTVGVMGSAPQLYQIALLSRYCQEIFLIFDADTAGNHAKDKALEIYEDYRLKLFDLDFIPVSLPDNMDPDDILKQPNGPKIYLDILKKAKSDYFSSPKK